MERGTNKQKAQHMQRCRGMEDDLSIHPSVRPQSIYPAIHLHINWFLHPSALLFIYSLCISPIHSFFYPSIQSSVPLFIHLSLICLFLYSISYTSMPSFIHSSGSTVR